MENIKEMGIKGQVIRGQVYFLNTFFWILLKKNPNTYNNSAQKWHKCWLSSSGGNFG